MLLLHEALGAGQTSKYFWVNNKCQVEVDLRGDFSSQTVTMQSSPTGATGTYTTYTVDGEAQTFTTAEIREYDMAARWLRFVCSGGGTPDIDIFVTGYHLHIPHGQ
jgi:uncharacterized iron-regulated membrane protein